MRTRIVTAAIWFGVVASAQVPPALWAAEPSVLLKTLREATVDGETNREAAGAWRQLTQIEAGQLPRILTAMDDAGPLAANWLRTAVDAIAERELRQQGELPVDELERFVLDTRHDPRPRRLAFEWLARADATAPDRLIPGMLNDSDVEFRRDAVDRLLRRAGELFAAADTKKAARLYQEALGGARDDDQIKQIVSQLRALGQQVDLPRHFGFLMTWKVIGPFDNTGLAGFEIPYPPEREIDFDAEYEGKNGPVRWQSFTTEDDYGMVDLNKPLGPLKEVVGYAWAEYTSDTQRDVELRLGCKNAWKVWLNGQFLFGREEYHRGMQLDQYRMKGTIRPGRNEILVKVCQNELVEDWTVEWQFQLRVCDATGTAILSPSRR